MKKGGFQLKNEEKIVMIQNIIENPGSVEAYYELLEKMDDLKTNYTEYMKTAPVNCDEELKRLPTADYELCSALLTMILREDYFCNGSFSRRYQVGQVDMILNRMLELLKQP